MKKGRNQTLMLLTLLGAAGSAVRTTPDLRVVAVVEYILSYGLTTREGRVGEDLMRFDVIALPTGDEPALDGSAKLPNDVNARVICGRQCRSSLESQPTSANGDSVSARASRSVSTIVTVASSSASPSFSLGSSLSLTISMSLSGSLSL